MIISRFLLLLAVGFSTANIIYLINFIMRFALNLFVWGKRYSQNDRMNRNLYTLKDRL